MKFKYNKDTLKENLTIEEVFELVNELGGEPEMKNDFFISKTICHNTLENLHNASHKLYYYNNTHLFHCYTECDETSFDIYELILKINKNMGIQNYTLSKAIYFIAKYFGYTNDIFDFEDNTKETLEDWKIINNFKKKKELTKSIKNFKLKTYDEQILKHFPQPHIIPWELENISYKAILFNNIHYNPIKEEILIPHYDINNNLIGVRSRTIIKENEIYGKYKPAFIHNKMYNHPLSFNIYNLNNSKDNIKIFKKAIIYEGEKSCIKHFSYFGKDADISVACCGSNLINYQVNLLLSLGVKEIIIAFDKQFKKTGDLEWEKWIIKLKTFYNKYNGYVNISYLFDTKNLLSYKDSPIDKGIEVFNELFKNRIFL